MVVPLDLIEWGALGAIYILAFRYSCASMRRAVSVALDVLESCNVHELVVNPTVYTKRKTDNLLSNYGQRLQLEQQARDAIGQSSGTKMPVTPRSTRRLLARESTALRQCAG